MIRLMKTMKMTQFFLIIVFSTFFTTSCTTLIKQENSNTDYEKDFSTREVPYDNCFAILPFTLNYTQSGCYPIIKIKNSFLLLDTGANFSFVGRTGVCDLFYDNYEKILNQTNEIPKDNNLNILLQPVGYWILPSYSDEKKSIPLFFTNTEITPFDGIIGEDCFQKFSNVIIDYKNKVIVFNGEKIKGESVPMIIDEDGLCFIEFLCSDIKEIGLIDTGSDCFIIRSSFMEKTCNYNHITKEEIEELKKRKVKITEPVNYSVKEIKIGKIKYKKILGMLGSDSRIKMTDEARGRLTEYSLLGFPFFKDKIIQLDYENKVFRIKR